MAPLISLPIAVTAVAAMLSSVAANPLPKRALTNEGTSLTLLYQNNLNATDDANHVGAILLDELTYAQAGPACAAIGESLISWGTLAAHRDDFERQLAYQSFIGKSKPVQRYYIANGVVSASQDPGSLQTAAQPSRDIALPVLCTQSSNSNSVYTAATASNKVTVTSGTNTFVGYRNQKSFRFLGIPYVTFPGRFKYSQYPSAPSGVTVDATSYAKQCSQPYQAAGATSEDCLILNIQTPYIPKSGSTERLRPVHFWIHGGGFTGGTGNDPGSDGGNLASREDVVTVNINYRLSTLGFLAIPGTDLKGNYAISDMVAALKWTIDNIAAFGGDPTRIVINGESAGGGSTRVLLGSPPAIELFQGAISMSNLGFGYALGIGYSYANSYSDYLTIQGSYNIAGQQIFTALGCTQAALADQIACLKTKDALALATASTVARYVVQDGYYVNTPLLDLAGKYGGSVANVDVIFGITRDDGASFSTYPKTPVTSLSQGLQVGLGINAENAQKVIDSGLFPAPDTGDITKDSYNVTARIATDLQFRCVDQATVFAGDATGVFKSAHYYQMDRTYSGYDPNNLGGPAGGNPNLPYYRVHGSDMPNVFGNLGSLRDANDLYTIQLSSAYFAEFIKKGTPNVPTRYLTVRGYEKSLESIEQSGRWSEVRGKSGPILLIDYPAKASSYVDVEQCAWLGYPLDFYLKN
ncbi:Cholinesterase [Dactylellina cionopaga]|nr:Cholinesterase [Dactylellina cionopaga]